MTYPWSLELKPSCSHKVIKGINSNDLSTLFRCVCQERISMKGFVHLSIHPSDHPSVCLSICWCVGMSVTTSSPLGPLPCFLSFRFTTMQSRATGIADHILTLGDLFHLSLHIWHMMNRSRDTLPGWASCLKAFLYADNFSRAMLSDFGPLQKPKMFAPCQGALDPLFGQRPQRTDVL